MKKNFEFTRKIGSILMLFALLNIPALFLAMALNKTVAFFLIFSIGKENVINGSIIWFLLVMTSLGVGTFIFITSFKRK